VLSPSRQRRASLPLAFLFRRGETTAAGSEQPEMSRVSALAAIRRQSLALSAAGQRRVLELGVRGGHHQRDEAAEDGREPLDGAAGTGIERVGSSGASSYTNTSVSGSDASTTSSSPSSSRARSRGADGGGGQEEEEDDEEEKKVRAVLNMALDDATPAAYTSSPWTRPGTFVRRQSLGRVPGAGARDEEEEGAWR
jgi:hypothetical protein